MATPELRLRLQATFLADVLSFVRFILNPSARGASVSSRRTLYGWLRLPFLAIFSAAVVTFILYPIAKLILSHQPYQVKLTNSWWQIILLVPFVEEWFFRFGLRNIVFYSISILVFICCLFTPFPNLYFLVFSLFGYMIFIKKRNSSYNYYQAKRYRQYLGLTTHLSCVLFALVHIFNYPTDAFNMQDWLTSPLLVLPQYFFAWVLAWIRLQSGIFFAIALHASYNGLILASIHILS